MVDLHKGFDGFEKLKPSDKTESENEELSLAPHAEEESLSPSPSDMKKSEDLYQKILRFVTDVFIQVAEGKEKQLNGKEIVKETNSFSDYMLKMDSPDDLVRLFFEHDGEGDNYIYEHSVNVCILCVRIARELHFSKSKMRDLVLASLFHDIGMMRIPVKVWNKDGRLKEPEYAEIRKHAEYGKEILENLDGISPTVAKVVGEHQEKIDGSGYPDHLTKNEMHYMARLIAPVDRYEAQTHTRLWKNRLLPDRAIQQMLDHDGSTYDSHFLKAILKYISIFPVGSMVRLSSGEYGVVVRANEETPMRPFVMVIYDRQKKPLPEERLIDLSKQLLIHVQSCVDKKELKTD